MHQPISCINQISRHQVRGDSVAVVVETYLRMAFFDFLELSLTVAELAEQVQRVFSLTGQSIELELDGSVMPSSFGLRSFSLNENSVVNVSVTTNEIGVIIPVSTTVGFSGLTPDQEEEFVAKIL